MRKVVCTLTTLMSALVFAQYTQDTIQVNEVTVNSNRFHTPLSKENRNVNVITRTDIEKMPARTLQEVLQYANGVDLRQRGVFGSQADISIDGGSFEQTLVLVNGVKISDHQTAHNTLNLPLPVEAIEQIEIVRGPAARVYGNNSLTGVINIITRKPKKSGLFVQTHFGTNFKKNEEKTSENYHLRGVQLGGAIYQDKHQHLLFASHDKSNGYRYNTAFENNKIFYQNQIELNSENKLQTSLGYVKNGFGANGFYAAPGDKDSKEFVETFLAAIQTQHQLNDRFTLKPQVYYRYNFDDYRYLKHNLNRARSKHYSNAGGAEVNATYLLTKGMLGFGVEYRHEQIKSTAIGDHTRDNFGFYGEYKVDWTERFNTNIGFYTNYNSSYDWQFFPGIDLSYQLVDGLKWIGNLGSSQRIPSFTDLYLDQRPGNIGNPEVEPEKAFQAETGFKWNKNGFNAEAFYFHRKINDFIDWVRQDSNEPWQANNFGNLQTNGVNIRTNYAWHFAQNKSLNFGLSYSYLDSEFTQLANEYASKYKIESLKHQFTNTLNFSIIDFSLGVTNRYHTRYSGDSYWVTDARMSYRLKDLTFYLDGQNIFGAEYREVGAIPLPSQWFTIGVKFLNF
ncbi:TonB-dependent receptor plug domain-containing protein [Vaginella massiliensis]|uniref:TonB-dependent receptor plug domain-containing protein n=1 Tax=Vaginella massiliensis TaxID=1816680 RepID=UPI000838F300|nr:TonB-dependent receptor [Vaginella massiliensis]